MKIKSLCVYCGSSPGSNPNYEMAAYAFGEMLAESSIRLIYGGGNVGLMGAVANGALSKSGTVIGVMPKKLIEKEVQHKGLTELHSVTSMHERKMKMADLADGFVALPGGIGTLEEILEVYTWTQLGFHKKPCGILNIERFYTPLIEFLGHLVRQRFMKDEHLSSLIVESEPRVLLARVEAYKHVSIDKWIDRRKEA
jgi:uncharacterized protein (TIGR00730 family)